MNRYQRELTFGRDMWYMVEKYAYKRRTKKRELKRMLGVLLCKLHIPLKFELELRRACKNKINYLEIGICKYSPIDNDIYHRITMIPYIRRSNIFENEIIGGEPCRPS